MGAGSISRLSDSGTFLALLHGLPCSDEKFGTVGINGYPAVEMVNAYHISVPGLPAGGDNFARGGGDNGGPYTSGNVQPVVKIPPARCTLKKSDR